MTTATTDPADICANCGKSGGDNAQLKKCSGCLLVKYCGIDCQRTHRPSHKTACQKQAAKLHEEKLFAQPPEPEECPVCFLRMPFDQEKICYQACCGKTICSGCSDSVMDKNVKDSMPSVGNRNSSSAFGDIDFKKMLDQPCPFCRTPFSIKVEDHLAELQKRIDLGDIRAMYHLGIKLVQPMGSAQPNAKRAKELLVKSAESGYPLANLAVGQFYYDGKYPSIFPRDLKKARQYFERGAIGGNPIARAYLGEIELDRFQIKTAYRHAMMAASSGYKDALDNVQNGFRQGVVSKEDYERTLRGYKKVSDELNSGHRSKAKEDEMFGGMGDFDFSNASEFPQMNDMLNMLDMIRNMGGK